MNLLHRFKDFINNEHLFSPKEDALLLAVSGGIDSVVLCELCHQAGYLFFIAHCNFRLRGEESERDKIFVQQLAQQYEVPFMAKDFDTKAYAAQHKVSIQVAARQLRYDWFDDILHGRIKEDHNKSENSQGKWTTTRSIATMYLATAHHLDDNIETLLMNFFKGTGIAGLRGIRPKQGKILRPLLFAWKEELRQFAEAYRLAWVEDSSNALDKYSRNYIRHQVLPLLEKIYPEVATNLADNVSRFNEIDLLYRQAIEQHKKNLLEYKDKEVHIPVLKLKKAAPVRTILYEILKDYGFSPQQSTEAMELFDSDSGKYLQSATHRIIKNRNWLIIAPVVTTEAQHIVIDEEKGSWEFEAGRLQLSVHTDTRHDLMAANTQTIAAIDADTIQFPLLLRPWKRGDYFYPLGMKKKKKLARFFIDQKLSKTDKEKVWVVEMNKKIVWVVGMRIDDRFKITGQTKRVLQLSFAANANGYMPK